MSNRITISLNDEYKHRLNLIAKNEFTDNSKIIRKWIDENFKPEYEDNDGNEK